MFLPDYQVALEIAEEEYDTFYCLCPLDTFVMYPEFKLGYEHHRWVVSPDFKSSELLCLNCRKTVEKERYEIKPAKFEQVKLVDSKEGVFKNYTA